MYIHEEFSLDVLACEPPEATQETSGVSDCSLALFIGNELALEKKVQAINSA